MMQKTIEQLIRDEVLRTEKKHPNWPKDLIHAGAIVGEESGELLRACVQFELENGNESAIVSEAIHTAATCIRLLKNL